MKAFFCIGLWMSVVPLFAASGLALGCAKAGYQFERMDGEMPTPIPLKFDGLYGARDGASVSAEARLADGDDLVTININLYLTPSAEFGSGTYQASIGGQNTAGIVECQSLTFLGGQTAQPSVGGVFILLDKQNRAAYRVRIPATTLTRRPRPH